jgi:hypothetical protein
MDWTQRLREVAEARKAVDDAQNALKAAADAWDTKYAEAGQELHETMDPLQKAYTKASDDCIACHNTLRADAEAEFKTGGKPVKGLEVKMVTQIIYDAKAALGWAKAHLLCLTLDKKAFEALAKTDSRPDFVTVEQEPKTFLGSDLSEYLG